MARINEDPIVFPVRDEETFLARRIRRLIEGLAEASEIAGDYREEIDRFSHDNQILREELQHKDHLLREVLELVEKCPDNLKELMRASDNEDLFEKYKKKPRFFRDLVWSRWGRWAQDIRKAEKLIRADLDKPLSRDNLGIYRR